MWRDAATVAASAEAARSVRTDGAVSPELIGDVAPGAVAWLEVGGTGVDLPVMRAPEGDEGFYLEHDHTGADSDVGVPYVAPDARPDGPAVMAFGHHVALTGGSFTELFDLWRPERFAAIEHASARWTTPAGGACEFRPLCAARVDGGEELATALAAERTEVPREGLHALLGRTEAKAEGAEEALAKARRSLVLVTCASVVPGQSERTLVAFVSAEAPRDETHM